MIFRIFSNKIHIKTPKKCGHLPYGGVDWNIQISLDFKISSCHLPYGGVDWNRNLQANYISWQRSPPIRRCGLKFKKCCLVSKMSAVTSYTEVWIEILYFLGLPKLVGVTSYTEVWIEISKYISLVANCICHLLYGGGYFIFRFLLFLLHLYTPLTIIRVWYKYK